MFYEFLPWCFALTFGKCLSHWCGQPLSRRGSICLCRGWPRGSPGPVRSGSPCWRWKWAHVDSGSGVWPAAANQIDTCIRGTVMCQLSYLKVWVTITMQWRSRKRDVARRLQRSNSEAKGGFGESAKLQKGTIRFVESVCPCVLLPARNNTAPTLFVQLHTAALRLIVRSSWDVPTFATKRLHTCHHARTPSGGRWNCGREMSGNVA